MIDDKRLELSKNSGDNAEQICINEFFQDLGWNCRPSTHSENKFKHFDIIVKRGIIKYKVDVKAYKKCRNYKYDNLYPILLEYTGITGYAGWLRGEADFIVQMMGERLIMTYRRLDALNAFDPPGQNIKRFNSVSAPISEWFGRIGISRAGTKNLDVIRWESLDSFMALVDVTFYAKKNGKWQGIWTAFK